MDAGHGLHGVHVGNVLAKNPHAVEGGLILQQVVATGAGGHKVDSREDALVAQGAV